VEVVEGDDLNPHDSCLAGSSANPQIVVDWCDLADKKNQYLDVLQELRVQELKDNINMTKLSKDKCFEKHASQKLM
jgi:hypothetical protein